MAEAAQETEGLGPVEEEEAQPSATTPLLEVRHFRKTPAPVVVLIPACSRGRRAVAVCSLTLNRESWNHRCGLRHALTSRLDAVAQHGISLRSDVEVFCTASESALSGAGRRSLVTVLYAAPRDWSQTRCCLRR